MSDNTITILGQTAHSDTSSLNIPKTIDNLNVTKVQANAFRLNESLISIHIPSTVSVVGENAFKESMINEITAEAKSKPDGWHDNWNPNHILVEWGVGTEQE